MQEHHTIFLNAENHAGDATVRQPASDFPQFAPERAYQRHTNRPRKLDVLDVFADVGIPVKLNRIPEGSRTAFRSEATLA
jgi:hypothetical protein